MYALNSEVKDLPKKTEDCGIRGGLEYACRSWYKHLTATEHRTADVVSALRGFLEKKFLFWLEVLSILGVVGDAARALNAALGWLNEIRRSINVNVLLDTAADCFRFVTEFFEVISQSGPHIYHSALQLSPRSSIVWNLYGQHFRSPAALVMRGIPVSWDSCTASAGAATEISHAVWSPCGKFIFLGVGNGIEMRDSSTLERTSVFEFPGSYPENFLKSAAVSPDGRLLACSNRGFGLIQSSPVFQFRDDDLLVVWDLQTGVILTDAHTPQIGTVAFAESQRTVAVVTDVHFSIYDGLNGVQLSEGQLPSGLAYQPNIHWAHTESLRFATNSTRDGQPSIDVWELRPTSTPSTLLVESFPVSPHAGEMAFSPVSYHASFVTGTGVVILDAQDSKVLFKTVEDQETYIPPGSFSPNGYLFACKMSRGDIRVWKGTPDGYTPWGDIRPRLPFGHFSFSPTAVSILTWGPGGVELLHPDGGLSPSISSKTEPDDQDGDHLATHSADETIVAVARQRGTVITISTIHSTTPQRSINTGMRIQDIKIVDNAILVADGRELVRWQLGEGGIEHNVRDAERVVVDETTAIDARAKNQTPSRHIMLSRDCSQIVFAVGGTLFVYDVGARRICNSHRMVWEVIDVRFSPDWRSLWFSAFGGWRCMPFYSTEFEKPCFGEVQLNKSGERPPDILFRSGSGCHLEPKSEWVSHSGCKLLWMPPSWRPKDADDVRWDGDFLALIGCHRPEPIVIKFSPQSLPPRSSGSPSSLPPVSPGPSRSSSPIPSSRPPVWGSNDSIPTF